MNEVLVSIRKFFKKILINLYETNFGNHKRFNCSTKFATFIMADSLSINSAILSCQRRICVTVFVCMRERKKERERFSVNNVDTSLSIYYSS